MKRPALKHYLASSVALMTFVVYLASLQNDFVEWDDSEYVFENFHIRSLDMDFFRWAFFDFYAANWHPLTWMSHALDYAVWGLNPLGHHLTNNILHAVNTFLVVLVVARLLEQQSNGRVVEWSSSNDSTTQRLNSSSSLFTIYDSRFILITSGVTGLLFGLHPLHVESVAWVAERKDLLCALFYLLSVTMYMRYAGRGNPLWLPFFGRPQGAAPTRPYLLSLCFFILALMSKPMAVSLPVVLLILDWYPFQRITSFKTFKASFMEKIPFIALSIASSVITVLAQKATRSVVSMEAIPFSTRLLVAAKSLITYLWKMLLPIDLFPFYPYQMNMDRVLPGLLSVALLAAITVISVAAAKKQRVLLSAWGCYVVMLVPVIGIVQVGEQAMADRYTYLPSLGPFLIAGLLTAIGSEKINTLRRHSLPAKCLGLFLAFLVCSTLAFLTFKQVGIWKNTFTLWNYVIEKGPVEIPLAYNNRGLAFGKAGLFDKAIEDFIMAIKLNPSYAFAYNNLGYTYFLLGQRDRALDGYNKAIALDRNYARAYVNRGVLYFDTNNKDLAMSDFQKACALGDNEGCTSLQPMQPATMNQ
jgi:protein O-mannosyl-transferase